MRLVRRSLSAWPLWLAGFAIAAVLLGSAPSQRVAVANDNAAVPAYLERIPLDADIFAHLRLADIYDGPLVQDVRKALGKQSDALQKLAEGFLGLRFDNIQAASFCFPRMPMGPGDEQTFMIVVGTIKPYDKAKLLAPLRKGEPKDSVVALRDNMVLHLTSDNVFAVMHKSLVDAYSKAPAKAKDGPLAETIRLAATGKHTFVGGLNIDALPAEIRTSVVAQPEIAPFKPLFDAQALTGYIDFGSELKATARFHTKDAGAAQDAERSWKLLMDLAGRGLQEVVNDKNVVKELGPALPAVKELQNTVKNLTAKVDGSSLTISASYKAGLPVAQLVKGLVERMQGASGRASTQNNLRQLSIAMHSYHDVYNGFPPAAIVDKRGKPLLSWRVSVLPFVEGAELYKEFKLDEPWDSEHNKKLLAKMPKVFLSPDNQKDGDTKTHYRLFYGNGAAFDLLQQIRLQDIQDGTSNTVMIVEAADPVEWTKPDDLAYDPMKDPRKLLRWVNDRVTVAFCDGSVRSIGKKATDKIWHLLIQRNDGNPIPNGFDE